MGYTIAISQIGIIICNREICEAELARAGTPIGPYDQMIAGHARASGLVLVTNNVDEFERVPGLRIEIWVLQ